MQEPKNFNQKDIYKLIYETSTEGILVCDNKGKIQMVNDSIIQIFGYEREEIIGQTIELFLPKEIKERHKSHRNGYIKSPERKKMGEGRDLYGLKKNGDKVPLEISLNHMTIEGELFVMGLITDISERKVAENRIHELNSELEQKVNERTKKLKENQILYNLITKNFPNGIICVLDKELKFIYAEGEELSKNGIDSKFLIGKNYLDSINKENSNEVEEILKKVFKGKVDSFEIKKRKNVYQVDAVPLIYEANQDISQVLIVEHNVTNIKNIEEKMKESLQKEKELNELKSRFVSMASHEFRTPLSTILSSLNLLERYIETDNETKRNVHISKIKRSINNLTNILDDTLTISKIEESKIELLFEKINVIDLINEIIGEIEGLKNLEQEFILNFAGEEVIESDLKILKIILANILSNALKYSEKDIHISIAVEENQFSVIVGDEGIGIPINEQKRLFERFYRANNASNIEGTGLGLNIVKGYITKLNGEINITSKENEGTTVTINMPISN
ncbi:PAS domain-containing sensor histidine kinase [Flavobacteriales bacterium]|nr:PAS domain-containing sensor histidine kinase [Flavobacteriales bacterium]